MPTRGPNFREISRYFGRYVRLHHKMFGWLAVVTLPISLILGIVGWIETGGVVVRNAGIVVRLVTALLNILLQPWVSWPLAFLAALYLMWRHFADQREIAVLRAAMATADVSGDPARAQTRSHTADAVIASPYSARASYGEGTWWLMLERPNDEVAGYRVTVTDPMGGGGRKEFTQSGKTVIVRFPHDFEVFGLAQTRQPWGRYQVRWDVFELDRERTSSRHAGSVESAFVWSPVMMPRLTQDQAEILMWMVEAGADSYLFTSVMGPGPNHSLIDGMGGERFLSPSDLHELEAIGLVRSPREDWYEVTNAGRDVYEQLKNPPPEPNPPGFRP